MAASSILIPQDYVQPNDDKGNRKPVRPNDIKSGTYYGQMQVRGSLLFIKDSLNAVSGYAAFGSSMTTIPTSSTTGTGILIDYSGIYGNNSGTKQFYLQSSDGKAYAGAGKVVLEAGGILLTDDGSALLRFMDGSTTAAYISGDKTVGYQQLLITNNANGTQPDGGLFLSNYDDNGNILYFTLFSEDGVGTYAGVYGDDFVGLTVGKSIIPAGTPTPPSSLLHLASTAPSFRMEDTTSSAKSLLLTVDGNTATFEEAGGTDMLALKLATGSVILGNGSIATNATDDFLYVAACAGTPTGAPTAVTGRIPIVADSTNNKLYIFSGGAWVALN